MSSVFDPAASAARPGSTTEAATTPRIATVATTASEAPQRSSSIWLRAASVIVLALLGLLALFHDTAWSMVAIWERSETFAHGFLILPMSLWMIYSKRHELAQLTPRPCWSALVLLVGAGLVWLVGATAGVMALGQAALVAMMVLLVWSVLGTAVLRTILFPLLFLFFMVPVGEFLMGPLIDNTADFVVLALRLSGIPVFREGAHFSIPSGDWSVVEACSGLRYLIASITLGCLFAYLSYRTLWRRAAFILASIIVPIFANWVRAYLIVMIAHLSSNKLATGVDHLIYGWVFFGLVMLLLFWVGSIWREDLQPQSNAQSKAQPKPGPEVATQAATRTFSIKPLLLAAVVSLALLTVWRPALSGLANVSAEAAPPLTALSLDSGAAWTPLAAPFTTWTPHYLQPRSSLSQTFAPASAAASSADAVTLFIGYYNRQRQHDELVTYNNQIVMITDKVWAIVDEQRRVVNMQGQTVPVVQAVVRGPAERLLVWKWYWIDGRWTDNDYIAKALIAFNMLTGRGDESAVILFYTPAEAFDITIASQRLQAFADAALPQVEQRLQSARAGK